MRPGNLLSIVGWLVLMGSGCRDIEFLCVADGGPCVTSDGGSPDGGENSAEDTKRADDIGPAFEER